ncbi:MAG: magnesium/cobalt transporter CorA [Bacteroidia bacterium]|nr:magnesium/cobalt transporter CorA [Bacteroidia bacterium]
MFRRTKIAMNLLTRKKTQRQKHNVGAAPGDMFEHHSLTSGDVKITMIQYNESEYFEEDFLDFADCKKAVKPGLMKWINVDGIHNIELIEKFGKWYSIHPLTQEDITHIDSRPKFEEYSRYVVAVLKMLYYDSHVMSEHLSILLFEDTVLSFQEPHGGDAFDVVRVRLRESKGRVRKMGPDYLAYALIDAVVDHYFVVLEKLGEKIEALDDEVLYHPHKKVMLQLHDLKKENLTIRKMIWPVREMIFNMMRSDTELISETNTIYLRDVHDHINKVNDTVEQYRESLAGIMEVYLSNNANKLNEVMKALTTISAIFIPVTFIAGIYGMNFQNVDLQGKPLPGNMPELYSPYGYWITLGVMFAIMITMAIWFKMKKWW